MSGRPTLSAEAEPPRRRLVWRLPPTWFLILATLFWGMGFSWAKNLGEAIDRAAGVSATAAVGPVTGLAVRFSLATGLWAAFVPNGRRGWSWRTIWRGGVIGLSLSLGLILQHVGLGLADESVIAFMTNLTVLFVPAWVLVATRRWPRPALLAAVPVALAGLALLSGVRGQTTPTATAGALFGVACAAAFAAEILLLDRLSRGESSARITLLLFAVSAGVCWLTATCLPGFNEIPWRTLAASRGIWTELVPLTGLTTLAAFAIMTACQPKVEPTRAAVLYLCEPLFAAAFAWRYNGRGLSVDVAVGAALILFANLIAEWKPRRV